MIVRLGDFEIIIQYNPNISIWKEARMLDKLRGLPKKEKRIKSGLRKCSGHKPEKHATYSEDNQCSLCGGYKRIK